MIVAPVRWALARRLSICLLEQIEVRQDLPNSDDERERTVAHLSRLVSVVIAMCSKDLFLNLINFSLFVLLLMLDLGYLHKKTIYSDIG
jgi:hypothetical protein